MDSSQYENVSEFAAAVEVHSHRTLDSFALRWPLCSDAIKEFPAFAGAVVSHGLRDKRKLNLTLGASQLEARRRLLLPEGRQGLVVIHLGKELQAEDTEMKLTQLTAMMERHDSNLTDIQSRGTGTAGDGQGDCSAFESKNVLSKGAALKGTSSDGRAPDLQLQHLGNLNDGAISGDYFNSHSHSELPNDHLPHTNFLQNRTTGTEESPTTVPSFNRPSTFSNHSPQLSGAELHAQLEAVNKYMATCVIYLKSGCNPDQFSMLRHNANPTSLPAHLTKWAEDKAMAVHISTKDDAHAHLTPEPSIFGVMSSSTSNSGNSQQQQSQQHQALLQQIQVPVNVQPLQAPQPQQGQDQQIGLPSPAPSSQFQVQAQSQVEPQQASQEIIEQRPKRSKFKQKTKLQALLKRLNEEDELDLPSSHMQFESDLAPGEYPPLFLDPTIAPLDLLTRERSPPTAGELIERETTYEELRDFNDMLGDLNGGQLAEEERQGTVGPLMTDEELERELEGWY